MDKNILYTWSIFLLKKWVQFFWFIGSDVAKRIITHTYMGTMDFNATSFKIWKLLLNKI